MAFEKINEFTDRIAADFKYKENCLAEMQCLPEPQFYNEVNTQKRARLVGEKYELIQVLKNYYETVLAIPKFKSQRDYCKRICTELDPAWSNIYFNFKPARAKKTQTS